MQKKKKNKGWDDAGVSGWGGHFDTATIDRMSGVWFWAWNCPDQRCGLRQVNFLGLSVLIWRKR